MCVYGSNRDSGRTLKLVGGHARLEPVQRPSAAALVLALQARLPHQVSVVCRRGCDADFVAGTGVVVVCSRSWRADFVEGTGVVVVCSRLWYADFVTGIGLHLGTHSPCYAHFVPGSTPTPSPRSILPRRPGNLSEQCIYIYTYAEAKKTRSKN